MTTAREQAVRFEVPAPIDADGTKVPAGTYDGVKREFSMVYMGKTAWLLPEYLLNLPDTSGSTFLSSQIEVTQYVAAGTVLLK
jgi:hypothetical protein